MRNVLAIFKGDLASLMNNVIAAIVVVGLVLVPPMYAWFTTLGFWDPYSNTGNLNVAVANNDEGFQSDLLPVKIDAGEQIIGKLHANDQFHWDFVGEDEAIDGVKSGKYYAAIVIPKDFSANLMTVFSKEIRHSDIVYYTNEKENAIAPRITDTGASTLQQQVDETFTETIADVALESTSNLSSYMSGEGIANYAATLKEKLSETASLLDEAALQTGTFAELVGSVAGLVEDSADLLEGMSDADVGATDMLSEAGDALDGAEGAFDGTASMFNSAVSGISGSFDAIQTVVDDALDKADPESKAEVDARIQAARDSLSRVVDDYEQRVRSGASAVRDNLEAVLDGASGLESQVRSAVGRLTSTSGSLAASLRDIQNALSDTSGILSDAAAQLDAINDELGRALDSGQLDEVRRIIGNDPKALASFLTAPTELVRHPVYEMPNNGSAMSPFYTSLSLWIGAIFLVALTSPFVPQWRQRQLRLKDPKPWQLYLGRYGVFGVLGLCQAIVVCLGNVFFLGIHCEHFWLYLLACCVTGIVFSNLVYTLAISFANVGKAIAVILLVMQLAGAGGIFPVQMSAQFFQEIYPWLPFAHSMEAFEGAMAGIYGMQYWISLGLLAALLAPMLLLGLVLRRPIIKMNLFFNEKLDETKLV